ncbi:MAG: hypothetical protein GY814_00635 [Gammaproteobacteria bacterium]|nr:hypothetical protein [Gammaproteobacteria bacterium]
MVAVVERAVEEDRLRGSSADSGSDTDRPAQGAGALQRFKDCLPKKPYCGDDKPAGLIRTKAHAIKENYIQANPPGMVYWITLDIDYRFQHGNDPFVWESQPGLPVPNFIVITPETGRCHISFAIVPVCTSNKGRAHPKRYLEAVRHGLALAYKADLDYTGRITKNPLSRHWNTQVFHEHVYSLGELSDYTTVTPQPKLTVFTTQEEDPRGRNSTLFLNLRRWSYGQVVNARASMAYDQWENTVLDAAERLNDFSSALPWNEVKALVRSVAGWTWTHYTGSPIRRGVMACDADQPLPDRQRQSADRTNGTRTARTEQAITTAITQLTDQQTRVSKAAVARITGISRQQISTRYGHLFDAEESVKSGVHQISAPGGVQNVNESNVVKLPIQTDQYSQPSVAISPRSGERTMKMAHPKGFKDLWLLFASMEVIAKADGCVPVFTTTDHHRLARVILAQQVPWPLAEQIVMEISARSVEKAYQHMTVRDWVGYVIRLARIGKGQDPP